MRNVFATCALLCLGVFCAATVAARPDTPTSASAGATQTVPLWPHATPASGGRTPSGEERVWQSGSGAGAVSNVIHARMKIIRPPHPNGSAVLIIGGGGLFRIQIAHEAEPTANWLAAIGVTPVILYYRLPADGWAPVAPFQDAQRAMRLLRAQAPQLGIDPQRIGVIGFSSGGDIAGITATRFAHDFYTPRSAVDRVSSRPDFAGLIYPVSSMRKPYDTTRTYRELAVQSDARQAYSVAGHVSADTPPVFIAHAADDPIVKVGSSIELFTTLLREHVPAELHVFEHGGHGWGLGLPGTRVGQWPVLFAGWMADHGWLSPAAARPQPANTTGGDDDDD